MMKAGPKGGKQGPDDGGRRQVMGVTVGYDIAFLFYTSCDGASWSIGMSALWPVHVARTN